MILQALAQLYERRAADPDPARRLPSPGLEDKDIPFIVELRPDGSPVLLRDTRRLDGKKLRAQTFLVPQGVKKTSGVAANLLWDTAEYTLGVSAKAEAPRLPEQTAAFLARVQALEPYSEGDPGLQALLAFLRAPQLDLLRAAPHWDELLQSNALVSFELQGDAGVLICQRPAVQAAIRALAASQAPGTLAHCLVDGAPRPVARLHGAIKGVWGAQTSGANIVSFNLGAYNSYGKEQGLNAPVGEAAVFAYTTALNALLDRDSPNRIQVGDASTVFWADAPHPFDGTGDGEFTLADLFAEADNPDKHRDAVPALFNAVRSGQMPKAVADTRFFVLGLSPNAARISIRFWLPSVPFAELAPRLVQHFEDIRVARRYDGDPETPSLFRLLTSLALQGKADNIPPRLAGEWMRAILEGLPLPAGLLNAAVQRCRAERDVPYLRACVLKAWLNRNGRRAPTSSTMPFKEALDMDNPAPAYRLGRLFATLERIQELAQPGINATIRDRYYGAASTTPVAVFTTLLRLKNAHLKKFTGGQETFYEKLIGEILAPMTGFPSRLTLPQQGEFALGYYHQRQAFFTKKAEGDNSTDQPQGD
ncbi:type I-C CRISPR-associated protein Cas8c/Csd1 [Pelomonas sp. P7]|uniref:Type I-C CRISPR-associated protein Cas8c/Csd1 n=1 Tax=Pelomonas caseinilytica TaxID=2906763 RepID=A0ABS8XFF0_9BURK|nr:type I-C CRISPR-associated protein Cas8c/Csd1 [Pelomonas sp. P7]MCE4537556.1 type I-C CRISPR-associated protein Cas8c/Csd1 [Pelomonas sp. P7]